MPDIKELRIDFISDSDAELESFLKDCCPTQLSMLAVNWMANKNEEINSKFYVDSFSVAAAAVIKEACFQYINFSAEDLQTVVKAAHNAEHIVFCDCSIHCTSTLDFGADLSYNTKFISFQGWGSMRNQERTTDWKTDPNSFKNIVDAISRSGLRTSLKKISIKFNQTLSLYKVQALFEAKGMHHIRVVNDDCWPSYW